MSASRLSIKNNNLVDLISLAYLFIQTLPPFWLSISDQIVNCPNMPPSLDPDNPPHLLRLPPPNNVLAGPPQPNDDPSVTDVRNAIRYEKEALIARGVYWCICIDIASC